MIKVQGLTKYYGSKPAAKDITFEVQKGEVFGLLGTNGAGKSTLIRIICCYLSQDNRHVKVCNLDTQKQDLLVKSKNG